MTYRTWTRCCLALGVAGVGVAAILAFDLTASRQALVREARQGFVEEAAAAAGEIDNQLEQAGATLDVLAASLSARRASDAELGIQLEAVLESDPEILGVGIAFAPTPAGGLHAPYRARREDSLEAIQLEDQIDYTDPAVHWYGDALRDGAGWREPKWDEVEGSTTAIYSAPFFGSGDRPVPAGVVFVSVSLDRLRDRVDGLDTGRAGWGSIFSGDGTFLVHPDEQWVEDRVNAIDVATAVANTESDSLLQGVQAALSSGERGFSESLHPVTGNNAWFLFEPVQATRWTLTLVRYESEILVTGRLFRRDVIQIALAAILGLSFLGTAIATSVYARRPSVAPAWSMAVWASLLMVTGMVVIRDVTYDHVSDEERETIQIFDDGGLQAFVGRQNAKWRRRQEPLPTTLPTGVLLRSLAFNTPTEVFVTGVVWQKFHDERHAGIARGVDLPDAIDAKLTEVYRRRSGAIETIGWRFNATLRQVMDVSRYPLDHDNVSIRMLPQGYDSRVILVPDLVSYMLLTPTARPGLEEALDLSGWEIAGSFFDYKYASYNTDLGIPDYEGEDSLPELHFNVELKRELLDASIANGIPLFVVLVLLFAILVTRTSNEKESKLFGFNPSGVVRICSALFFVVLLAHIQLRRTVQAQEIVFLEYSYFLVYLAILLTALHTFLFFKTGVESRLVEYQDGLIAKVAYWPVLLGLQLLAAVLAFY
jgi:hypothetical protein